ncbi:MAG TPA: demethoxyubiquinone hydroxylase family protein [Parvularcula sp.]|nr:demethoxyubiquinone hydroxylase family protein [Parvularcula sp.]HBS32747.1 demethoxyubiquinone hydroxylase family protein [Parvularcula sp.]HBS35830.1 demethoxyubiquinone hydroxylase family protein [Parvularcula sp.]
MSYASTPSRPGPRDKRLHEMLRVDHAGEYGAVQIYRGQRAIFDRARGREDIAAVLKEMEKGEAAHLKTFDRLLAERSVRPTLLAPIWNAAGFALGAATALMGEKAAMAATAAVEDVIEKHYAAQAAELEAAEPALAETVARFREDELGHKATAEAHGAKEAPAFTLMRAVISAGCRVAIGLSEKI